MRDYRVSYTARYRTYTIDCHVVKMAKQVLVRVGENSRPVTIEPGDLSSSDVERLKQSIYKCFDDVLKVDASESILLQIKSEQWYGEFVDIEDPAMMIPDKSVIKVKILQVFYFINSNLSVHGILKLFINVSSPKS